MSLSEKLAGKKFPHRDLTICLDADLLLEREQLKSRNDDRLTGKSSAVKALEKRIADASVTIRVNGMPFAKYQALMARHPGRKGKQEPFNPVTFFPAVAGEKAEYLEDGEWVPIGADEWKNLTDALTDGEFDRIAQAAMDVNRAQGLRGIDFLGGSSETITDSDEISESLESSE